MTMKMQIKKESASPTDPEAIADELKLSNDIRYHEGSFYIFDEDCKTWNQCTIDDIKSLILYQLPGGYNQTKVNAIIEVLRLKSRIQPVESDRKKIIFKNGLLNLNDSTFRPFNKFDFVVDPLQADYIPEANCPRFIQFLDEIFISDPDKAEKIQLLRQFIGLSLTKDTSFQKAMLFIGNGSNGKSVILNLLESIFGNNNISKLELGQLGNPFHVPSLQNKYINVCTEINSKERFSEALFKSIVSGETIFADRKFQDPFQFKPFVRLVFATNNLPYSSDNSFAFYRRWLILKFNRTFRPEEQDRSLPEKLNKELSGIINWALIGLNDLHEKNRFTEPDSHKEALMFYELMNNNVAVFSDEMIDQEPGSSIQYSDIYQAYVTFCSLGGYRAKSKINFKTELMSIFPAARFYTGHGQYKFENIKLKSNEPF